MVSDSELVDRIHEFLSTADLENTTNNVVRRKLEEDFNIDLSDRKVFIREQIDLYLESYYQVNQENEEEMEVENDQGPSAAEVSEQEEDPEEDEEEEDPEEEEEEEESKAVDKGKRKSSEKKPGKKNESGKRKAGGFTKICSLSPQLQKITGEAELARTEVVKRMWHYINANELKNPSDRRIIICDDTLRELFGVATIGMFEMNKALTKHIWPLDSDAANKKQRKQEEDEDSDEPKKEEKQKNSGMHAPLRLSNALINFLGTGESELSRPNVVKRIWEYIKQNGLQDPSDERQIICDEKLKELFHVEIHRGIGVTKLLSPHLIWWSSFGENLDSFRILLFKFEA